MAAKSGQSVGFVQAAAGGNRESLGDLLNSRELFK